MDRCTVCGSANLNHHEAVTALATRAYDLFWCEDCGTLHQVEADAQYTSCPEKSMLHHQVTAFHKKFGQPIAARPHVPSEAMVRFRLKLHLEEFFELLAAAGVGADKWDGMEDAHHTILDVIEQFPIKVNLPELVDALGDMDYISEGTRLVFGVDGAPVADEIQRANMSKEAVVVRVDVGLESPDDVRTTTKPTKPAGWTPPDNERVLIEQGWKP